MIQKRDLIETFGEALDSPVSVKTLLSPSQLVVLVLVYYCQYHYRHQLTIEEVLKRELPKLEIKQDTIKKALRSMGKYGTMLIDFVDSSLADQHLKAGVLLQRYKILSLGQFKLFIEQRFMLEVLSLSRNLHTGVQTEIINTTTILAPMRVLILAIIEEHGDVMKVRSISDELRQAKSVHTESKKNSNNGLSRAGVACTMVDMAKNGLIIRNAKSGYKITEECNGRFPVTIRLFQQLVTLLKC